MEILLSLGIALAAGLLLSRFIKPLKLPAVTGYLIAGILIGPYCLGRLDVDGLGFTSMDSVKSFKIVCETALGFIAFAIGNEFRLSSLKQIGKQATVIAIFQALVATLFVDVALVALHFAFPDKLTIETAIVLGAIATATAPAATLMVVRQYKAKGPLTSLLLPVVALDDAIGLIVFAISFGIAKAMMSGAVSVVSMVVNPLLEVVLSLALGAAVGVLFTFTEKLFKSNSKRQALAITYVIIAIALSMMKFEIGEVHISFSSLLVCMMLGTVFCNMCEHSEEIMEKTDKWTAPIFILFFVVSGAELELSVFTDIIVVVIGLVYILARSAGKISGAYVSAKMTKCEPTIQKFLGITLLPQAGVALGMSLTAANELEAAGELIRNISLFAVLIYELIGPMLTKIALIKAGEIVPKQEVVSASEDEEDDE
ncbi:MAG: cation:proton antiporter [Clostridia bacterium]|nr:cation:proton antiporter [Clostridia bacterium]